MTTLRIAAAVAVFCLFAMPAYAAIQLDPGEWQDTETGTENGAPVKPEATTSCMTAAEAKDVVKALTKLQETAGQKCKALNVKESGKVLTFDMECGEPKTMLIAISMNITFLNSRHYTGTLKSNVTYAGKTIATDKQLDSKWIGATCKEK